MRNNFFGSMIDKSGFEMMGRKGILKLPNGNVLETYLETSGTHEKYTRIIGRIVNPKDGEISSNSFHFKDYLFKRVDTRTDYKDGFHIWRNQGDMEFYIAKPDSKEITNMVASIVKWAKKYE